MGCLKLRIEYFKRVIKILITEMTCSCRSYEIYLKFVYIIIMIVFLSWISIAQIHDIKIKTNPYQNNNKLDSPILDREISDVTKKKYPTPWGKADDKCDRYQNVPYFRVYRNYAIGSSNLFGRDLANHTFTVSRDSNELSEPLTSSPGDNESHQKPEEAPWERDSGIPLLTLNELYTASPNESSSTTNDSTDAAAQMDNVKLNGNPVEDSTLTPSDFVLVSTEAQTPEQPAAVVFEETTEIPSFNEWKQIMMVEREKAASLPANGIALKEETGEVNGAKGGGGTGGLQQQQEMQGGLLQESKEQGGGANASALPSPPPQNKGAQTGPTRPPNMNNYASLDCGAKILHHNPEAVNAGGILNRNLDEYMLNPCSATIWFTFELCEPIQVKSIEIANLELFSSSPKQIRVHISDRYPTREWLKNKTFVATDERRVQAFPLDDTMFARYIKVELLSHYGHEHYCPLTLIRVYGTSMIEEYDDDAILDPSAHDAAILDHSAALNSPESARAESPSHPNESTTTLSPVDTSRFAPVEAKNAPERNRSEAGPPSEPKMSNGGQEKAEGDRVAEENDTSATGLQGAELRGPRNILISAKDAVLNIFNHATNVLTPPNFNAPLRSRELLNITQPVDDNDNSDLHLENISETKINHLDILTNANESTSQSSIGKSEDIFPLKIEHLNDTETIKTRENIKNHKAAYTCPTKIKTNIFNPLSELPVCRAPKLHPKSAAALSTPSTPTEAPLTPSDIPAAPNSTPQALGGGGVVASHKESIFMRLNNRIKMLELNVSLSGRYLEELSKRYRKQMEDMATAFNRTARALNETARVAEIKYGRHEAMLEELRSSLNSLSSLVEQWESKHQAVSVRSSQFPYFIVYVALLAIIQMAVTYYLLYRLVPRRVAQLLAAPQLGIPPPNGLINAGGPFKNGGHHIPRAPLEEYGEGDDLIPKQRDLKSISPKTQSPCPSTNLEIHEEETLQDTAELVPSSPSFTLARPKKKRKKLLHAIRQSTMSWNDPCLPWPRVILLPSTNHHLQVARSFKHTHPKPGETLGQAQFFGPQFLEHLARAKARKPSLPQSCSRNYHRYSSCRHRKYSHPTFEYA